MPYIRSRLNSMLTLTERIERFLTADDELENPRELLAEAWQELSEMKAFHDQTRTAHFAALRRYQAHNGFIWPDQENLLFWLLQHAAYLENQCSDLEKRLIGAKKVQDELLSVIHGDNPIN